MDRYVAHGIIFGLVCFLLWVCSFSTVQASSVPASAANSINTDAQPDQQTGQSENQHRASGRKNERRKTPKLERNRLGEGKKSAPVTKRKKRQKSKKAKTGETKAKGSLLSDDGTSHILNKAKKVKDIRLTAERVDDIPLLIKAMMKMGIQEAIDQYIPAYKNQRDLSWGWTAVIWLAYMLSEGDHRKVVVREYVSRMRHTLMELTGLKISENDFTDDRLANIARYLSDDGTWKDIEERIGASTVEAYELPEETARVDATTVSGYHKTVEGGIFQFGVSKDDPNRPQIKIMTGSLDPLGMPLATDVVPGQMADDKLYAPIISRIHSILKKQGVLYVGDCKLSSLENRLHIKGKVEGHYLCPLPNTGKTTKDMEKWIDEGNLKDKENMLIKYVVQDDKGQEELKAKGYEIERNQSGEIDGKVLEWKERVLIVKSPAYEKQKTLGLERRLRNAEEQLYALTPPRGPGKRQIKEEEQLKELAEGILKKHRVKYFLKYEYVREVESKTKYIGKGRGSKNKEKKIEEKIRYQITEVTRSKEAIDAEKKKYGWKAYVTDVSMERLCFIDVVSSYRKQYRVERIFNRLKSRLNIAPFYVKREDQVKGITHLLMIGVKVITLIEFTVRRSLARNDEKLVGLHPGNPKKATSHPTCEKLLSAFSNITLTIIEEGGSVKKHLTSLSQLQREILKHLGFSASIYDNLEVMR
jgi:transposase